MIFPQPDEFKKLSNQYNRIPIYKELNISEPGMLLLLKVFNEEKNLIFLESAREDKEFSRFSYLGFNASESISFFSDYIIRKFQDQEERLEENIFDYLREKINKFKSPTFDQFGTFNGGYSGIFGYETINHCGILRKKMKEDKNAPLAQFALIEDFICHDNELEKYYIATSVYIDDQNRIDENYEKALKHLDILEEQIISKISTTALPYMPAKAEPFEPVFCDTYEEFTEKVAKTSKLIHEGEAIQVVLSMRAKIDDDIDPYLFYLKLRKVNPSPYMYYLKFDDVEIVGSSPEVHVKVNNNSVFLKPIAGTVPQAETEEENRANKEKLLNDKKERAEHLMLVDLARNDLARIAKPGSVDVKTFMVPEDYSHVIHLVSYTEAELSEKKDVIDVLKETFPAGTVSGAPKVRALEIIDELEKEPRSYYAGAIGYIGFNNYTDTCITIRTAYFTPEGNFIQAGAGIVQDSVPHNEYMEIVNKLKALSVSLPFGKKLKSGEK